jgi:hypothetical protein
MWGPPQEIIPPCAHGTICRGYSCQQARVAIHCRQRTTIGAGTPMLPVVVPVADVGMARVSALDRHCRRGRGHAYDTRRATSTCSDRRSGSRRWLMGIGWALGPTSNERAGGQSPAPPTRSGSHRPARPVVGTKTTFALRVGLISGLVRRDGACAYPHYRVA